MLGLELTDDEMARVMEMREKWSDDERINRAAGMCVSEMVQAFALLAETAERYIVRQKQVNQGRKNRSSRRGKRQR